MNIKTYHILCCMTFSALLLSPWFCICVVAAAWLFQMLHLVLVTTRLQTPRYHGVTERFKRECYAKSGVTILKPLCGTGPALYENLRTYFTLEYPVFELIFCVATDDDPALAAVQRLQQEFPDVSTIVSVGVDNVGVNPKVCNAATGYKAANYDLVWMTDASIVASDAALQDMVDQCVSGARLVHQIPWAVSGPAVEPTVGAMSCGSILERWYFATAHGRPYMVINHAVCTCLNGMSNLFSKPHMDELGGLGRFGALLNEDGEIGVTFDQHGFETALSKHVAIQNVGPIAIRDYVARRVRWMRLRNKYAKTQWLTPLEMVLDTHFTSLLCLTVLVYHHGLVAASVLALHQCAWMLVDSLVFMLLDRAVPLPKPWQGHRIDWGRVSKSQRGIYFYLLNIVEHYAMWLVREYITLYIRIVALRNTESVVWKDQELPIEKSD